MTTKKKTPPRTTMKRRTPTSAQPRRCAPRSPASRRRIRRRSATSTSCASSSSPTRRSSSRAARWPWFRPVGRRVRCAASRSSQRATSACDATGYRTETPVPGVTDDALEIHGEPPANREAELELLVGGELEVVGRLTDATNATFVCRVTSGASEMIAVYKPRRGERPLDDFPVGTLANRERAAYL